MSIRINKYFTEQGYCSRREADKLIETKQVTINGRIAVLGDQVEETDIVTLSGKQILFNPKRTYIMYNKPRGVTCTTDLKISGNIIEAVNHHIRVFPIGRLDKDSSGLIFLTNDGDIVNQILRAQFGHEKEYVVELYKNFDDSFMTGMGSGVDLGDHTTKPCKVSRVDNKTFKIILTEGKNRQIRRMCEFFKHKVKTLKRIRIMNILIKDLPEAKWKDIPSVELQELKDILSKNATTPVSEELETLEE